MNQEDIFKLLLLVLLFANSQQANLTNNAQTSDATPTFSYTSINDLLLICLLLKGLSANDNNTNNQTAATTF